MTEHEIFVAFAAIVEELSGVPASRVTLTADLADDLNIDSLVMVEVIVATQDRFHIEIPDEDLKDFKSVHDVVNYVRRSSVSA
jgi:acyl carrier protein